MERGQFSRTGEFFLICAIACASLLAHAGSAAGLIVVLFTPTLEASHANLILYNGNPINPFTAPTPSTIDASSLTATNNSWTITQLGKNADNVSLAQGAYVLERIDPATGHLEGATPIRGTNYDLVHAAWSSSATSSEEMTFTLPMLGDPATPSGTYELLFAEEPQTKSIYDADTDTSTIVPFTDDDLGAYLAGDPEFESNVTANVRLSNPIRFDYVADLPVPATTTPVIIVPGILGSAEHNGVWVIDPITHMYDNLIDTLVANGYQENVTLFTFPYDWHESNVDTALLLKGEIDHVKTICGCSQVDIVAHSMGGLAARQYIQSPGYAHDVRKLIFLGTPQLGAPEDYLMWEGGETDVDEGNQKLKYFLQAEAFEHGYSTLFSYIRATPIASVQELLPVYGYIKHIGSQNIPSYPNTSWYPSNPFLENLDNNIDSLYNSGVSITNIVGDLASSPAITTIRVVATSTPSSTAEWGYGFPENFGNSSTDQGLERGDGDDTVPISSADLIPNNLQIINSGHSELPTNAEGLVFKTLTGDDATTLINNSQSNLEIIANILILQIFSPADIEIIAPDGEREGKDFSTGNEFNEIPGAFYSGYQNSEEYVTVPNPEVGQYKVITQGTGNGGEYTVGAGMITDSTSTETFFSGQTLPGLITEQDVHVDPAQPQMTTIIPADQTPPTITFIQPATSTYTHGDILPIKVTFSDATGVGTSSVSMDGTLIGASSTVDLFYQTLGNHKLTASAKDLVNNATTSTKIIQVVATASSTESDINRAFTLGWISSKDFKNLFLAQLYQSVKLQKVTENIPSTTNPKKTQTITVIVQILDTILLKVMLAELAPAQKAKLINAQAYTMLAADVGWLISH